MLKICHHFVSLRTRIFCAVAIFSLATPASPAELPAAVTDALKSAGIPLQSVAVVVHRVDSEQALISHNAQQAMNPASVMKILTTYAALEIHGPAYTWLTKALADAPIVNGQLNGNLYLRGSGDPRLALEQFSLFLRQLRTRGIQQINGDLVLDRSAFSLPPHNPASFDNEPLRPYNTGPDALLINFKSLSFILHPDTALGRVDLLQETPGIAPQFLDNRLNLSKEACGSWREKVKINVEKETIILSGKFPAACGDKPLNLSPWPANAQVGRLFIALWNELGGTWRGRVREGTPPANAQVLATHQSPTLGEVVREVNKYSNNVMASQVFLTLDSAQPATFEGAQRRIRAWLAQNGLSMPELVLENGSGLSRRERISADHLGRLLLAAWRSPVMPELMASFPIAGTDGTLKKRLGDGTVLGRAHLKTGYLGNVRSLAGYVLDSKGNRWVVVFLVNDPRSVHGKPAMDALVNLLTEQGESLGPQAQAAPSSPENARRNAAVAR